MASTAALFEALETGGAKEVSAALRAGASPDACDPDGRCALAVAAAGNKTDCVRLLLARGASLSGCAGVAGGENKPTPLAAAAAADAAAAVWLLRDAGAPGADEALTAAAGACAQGAVTALLSPGPGAAAPDGAPVDGRGALHVAAANGDIATVPALLKAGANASKVVHVQEEYDETYTVPLTVARGERVSGPAPVTLLKPRGPGGERGNLPCVAWSPDGRSLVTAAEAGGVVQLFDAATGAPGAVLGNHDYCPYAVVHGGSFVASGGCDNKIKLFDVKTAACVTVEAAGADGGSGACVAYLALSPDGKRVAAATRDGGAIRIYGTAGGAFERELKGHAGEWVRSVAWSADGKLLASGGDDTKIWIWSVESGDKVAALEGHTNSPYGVAFSPDGRLASAGDRSVRVWAPGAGGAWSCVATKGDLPDGARSVAWSADGRLLAAGLEDGGVEAWDAQAPYDLAAGLQRTHGGGWVNAMHFSPDSGRLATAGLDGNVEVYDVVDAPDGKRTLRAFEEKTRPATRMVAAPSALHLAAAGGGGSNSIHVAVLRALLAAGADVAARDGSGRTPLHAAAAAGNLVAVVALMAAGADVEAEDGEGDKACQVSYSYAAVQDALSADGERKEATEALLKRCVGLTPAELDWARTSPALYTSEVYVGHGSPAKEALATMVAEVLQEYSAETTSAKLQAFAASFAAKAGAADAPSLVARRKLDADVRALCAALGALVKGDAQGAAAACAAAPPCAVRAAALQAWELFEALKVDTAAAFAAAAEADAQAEAATAADSAAMEEEFGKMAEAMGGGEPDQERVALLQSQIVADE